MDPITPPASSPAKRKRSHEVPDSPITPTRPRLQIPSQQQDIPSSAMSPRAQVAGRFRNLSIEKDRSSPPNQFEPLISGAQAIQMQPQYEKTESYFGSSLDTDAAFQDESADILLQQLSNSQKQLLASSSPTPAKLHPPPPPPAQISPSGLPCAPPLPPLTASEPTFMPLSHNDDKSHSDPSHGYDQSDPQVNRALFAARTTPRLPQGTFDDTTTAQKEAWVNATRNKPFVCSDASRAMDLDHFVVEHIKLPAPSNKAAKTASSPSPTSKRARSPPPPPTSIDPDEDDMTGVNGIGYRPTPAQAYARAQKRRQQVKEWKVREEREMRGRRAARRRGGAVQEGEVETINAVGKRESMNVEGERKVRFVGVMG